jgi:hypothetical protein
MERFYCSALVAANGHRLGTMCIGGERARKMDAHQLNILCNLAELAVRRLERKWAAEQWAKSAGAGLARTLATYARPLLLVEVSSPASWEVLYASPAAAQLLGEKSSSMVANPRAGAVVHVAEVTSLPHLKQLAPFNAGSNMLEGCPGQFC